MNKISIMLWVTVVLLAVLVVDYNYNPQHYIYSSGKANGTMLYVISDGWRNQPLIVEPSTPSEQVHSFIADREILYKMPLQSAPEWVKIVNNVLIGIMFLMFGLLFFLVKKIVDKKSNNS